MPKLCNLLKPFPASLAKFFYKLKPLYCVCVTKHCILSDTIKSVSTKGPRVSAIQGARMPPLPENSCRKGLPSVMGVPFGLVWTHRAITVTEAAISGTPRTSLKHPAAENSASGPCRHRTVDFFILSSSTLIRRPPISSFSVWHY